MTRSAVERALGPVDLLRRDVLRVLGRPLAPLWADRGMRVTLLGLFSVSVALGLAARLPLWTLAVAPLLLGVPHLVADARYLLARQGLLPRRRALLAALLPVAAATLLGRLDVSFVALIALALVARAPWSRRAAVIVAGAGAAALAFAYAGGFGRAFAHGHNLVALGLWAYWARGLGRGRWLVLALVAAGVAALLGGALDGPLFRDLRAPARGLDAHALVESLALVSPWSDPLGALRQTAVFAFLQGVHYAVWLRLLPEEDRARAAPRPFASSWRALVDDLGAPFALGAAALAVAFALAAFAALASARDAYLRLALGHGTLELAVVALAWMERAPLRRAAST